MDEQSRVKSAHHFATLGEEVKHASPSDEADSILATAYQLNEIAEALEDRIFERPPRPVERGAPDQKEDPVRRPLMHTLRHARQRLDTANDRLASILKRL